MGFCCKNGDGEVLRHLQGLGDALHAEAQAAGALQAIKHASEMGCNRIILETDAVNLKQAITGRDLICQI